MTPEPELRSFEGVVCGDDFLAIPLRDPDDGSWWTLSADGVSYWEGPEAIRAHAAGLVEEGIDDAEPGIAAGYRALADLIDRLERDAGR
jgi:hypothetical protein